MALTLAAMTSPGLTDSEVYFTGTTDATAAAAQNVYLGFTPREVWVFNVTDILENRYVAGLTADYYILTTGSTGAVTIPTSNGFTALDGTEVVPASTLVAQGTNGVGGKGIKLGTAVLVASKSYILKFIR